MKNRDYYGIGVYEKIKEINGAMTEGLLVKKFNKNDDEDLDLKEAEEFIKAEKHNYRFPLIAISFPIYFF